MLLLSFKARNKILNNNCQNFEALSSNEIKYKNNVNY